MPGTLIVLVFLLIAVGGAIYGTVRRIKYGSSCCGTKDAASKKVKVKDKNKKHYPYVYVLKVNGMHCSGCVRNIENAFNSNEGMWAKASLEKKEVLLRSMRAVERKEAADIAHEANYTLMDINEM